MAYQVLYGFLGRAGTIYLRRMIAPAAARATRAHSPIQQHSLKYFMKNKVTSRRARVAGGRHHSNHACGANSVEALEVIKSQTKLNICTT